MLADVRQRRIVELVERFGWVEVGELKAKGVHIISVAEEEGTWRD